MAHSTRYEKVCASCGAAFVAKLPYAETCSKRCQTRHYHAKMTRPCTLPECERKLYCAGLCRTHYKQSRGGRERYDATCITCELAYKSSRKDGKFCSDECKGIFYSDTLRQKCKLPEHHPVMVNIRATRDAERLAQKAAAAERNARRKLEWRTARECPGCGCAFSPLYTPNMLTCSRRCSRRVHRWRRKAAERGALGKFTWSEFMRVAQRFDFSCAYCGDKPGQLDPDHVIPLSRGGSNSTTNLLPACRPCNTDKNAHLLNEWAESRERRGLPPRMTNWAPEDKRFWHLTDALLAA